jgi:hypothetical protein
MENTLGIQGTYWEHIGNLMRTELELERNMLGTRKNEKFLSPPPPNPKHFLKKIRGYLFIYLFIYLGTYREGVE